MCVRLASAADRTGSDATSMVSGVDTNPGQTELTHTPEADHASDCDRVSAASPDLVAPYPPLLPNARIACCEVMLMIRPQPRAAIAGPKRCPSRNGAVRLTAIMRSQCSSDREPSSGRRLTPAQLTRMSGSPNEAAAADAPRRTSARSERSALTQAAAQPASRSVLQVADSLVGSRATSTTCAPANASPEAIASPIPELPPVTTATRPSSENNSFRNPVMPDAYHTLTGQRDHRHLNVPKPKQGAQDRVSTGEAGKRQRETCGQT